MCTVEGVVGGSKVPGVQDTLAIPNNTCTLDDQTCGDNPDLQCNLEVSSGNVCSCSAGADSCTKYSPCASTPCKVCSDCLAHMTEFATSHKFTSNRAALSEAFKSHCELKGYDAAACDQAVTQIQNNTKLISFGKRAGQLCQAMNICTTQLSDSCSLKPTVNLNTTGTNLHLCKIEGVTNGNDLPGIFSVDAGIPKPQDGQCISDSDCNNAALMCDTTLTAPFCTCYKGVDECRNVGKCVKKPCIACGDCLSAFQDFVANEATTSLDTAAGVATRFAAACRDLYNTSLDACENARQAIASSYKGNAGRRAGSICKLLGECVPSAMRGCK